MSCSIHVGFGFHVNCYHSYRGDTPDEKGFGSDLRIIRQIIAVLDRLNAEGIPVRGTWDSENFFSLEQILPEYAPDIIEGMKRRVRENGDENIIMGYSNGALSAMQEDELAASISLAVSNPQGSGLNDIFGTCEKIVRPQEMMFTPSQVSTYNRLGVDALCLYYSCIPFDGFKTLIPPLDDEKAFNPLYFEYKGERIKVIPTVSNADICDAGCLRALVKDLRKKQISGEIDSDLFIFINMDADAIFWESLNLPVAGSRIPNTDGINGLVREVADLDYVVFDTPGGYLRTHSPAGTISFTQDTADGNFTGYASWAEKPYNRKIWTAIERSRTAAKADPARAAFDDRVKLLSTTHFGLATPVLNIQREASANQLAEKLLSAACDKEGPLTIHNTSGTALQCLQLSCGADRPLIIEGQGLAAQTVVPVDEGSVFVMLRFDEVRDKYTVTAREAEPCGEKPSPLCLESAGSKIVFSKENIIESFTYNGKVIGSSEFLRSYLTYGKARYDFRVLSAQSADITGGECVDIGGSIILPCAVRQGSFRFRFFTSEAAPGIFVITDVDYPYTSEKDAISTENSTLGRYTDMKWTETAPFTLSFENEGEVSVIKRNFEGDICSYRVSSYKEADEKNASLDSFNNHLTAGLTGVTDGKKGLITANARNVLSSMALCPMRLEESGRVIMNPFGTFYGNQRHHPNRSGDRIPLTYTLIAPQGKSLAPSYNGSREKAVLCLLPFENEMPGADALSSLLAFCDGAWASGNDALLSPFEGENVAVHRVDSEIENPEIHSPLLSGIKGNYLKYAVRGVRAVRYIMRRKRYSLKD